MFPPAGGQHTNDELGGDDEEDDRLDDRNELRRDAGVGLHDRATARERTEQERREGDPDGRVLSEKRDRDRVETVARGEPIEYPVEEARDMDYSSQARAAAGDGHRDDGACARI